MAAEKIETPVGQLAVRVTGTGRPAVLWHSLFVDHRSWDRVVQHLAPARRLVLVDGPGHGDSGDPGRRYSVAECAEAARVVLEHLRIGEPVDWVGNAWGGHVGAAVAARWPELCRTLVMLGTPVAALTAPERARTHLLLALHRLTGPSATVVGGTTNVLLSAHTRAHDPDAVALVQACLREADRRMLRNAVVSASLHRQDLTEELRRLTQPTLVVTGTDHHGFTPEQARAAVGLLAHGQSAVVQDAAYLLPLEAPEVCARLVAGFWVSHDTVVAD